MIKTITTSSICLIITMLMPFLALATDNSIPPSDASGGGGLPQFDPTSWPSQIFWLGIFFTLLYFVFGKSIIPSLSKTIETRHSYIEDNIKKAEALSQSAESLRNEMNEAMKIAGQTAGSQVSNAENEAKSKLSSALVDFRLRYEQQVAETERNIQTSKQSAMIDMEKIVISLAAQAAEKIAGIPASESGAESVVKSLSKKAA